MTTLEPEKMKKQEGDNINDLTTAASQLSISGPVISNTESTPIDVLDGGQDTNPWEERAESAHQPIHRLKTPDPTALESTLALGNAKSPLYSTTVHDSEQPTTSRVSGEILREFDPLADVQEKNAQDAWASADAHPPPKGSPTTSEGVSDPGPVTPPKQTTHGRSQSASSGFNLPSLASFARSVQASVSGTVAGLASRPRPAEPNPSILSPTTISSFVAHGGDWPRPESRPESRTGKREDTTDDSRTDDETSARKTGDSTEVQFDFPKFLEQMKSKSAEPVAKYLRSFLSNFAKRTFTVSDQVKVINEFLVFIAARMRETDIWRNASDTEFDHAMEAMEKLVMNRLYDFTFTPQLTEFDPPRPITTDDLERDRVLAQRIAIFSWIEESHLDVPEGPESRGFLMFAQQELLKINHYKAPRDKLICVLNCCKVIFGLLRHLHREENADSFVPILIYVVLKANPPHLISNIEYINRFRNPQKLQSETGYYLSSLMGAVSFIETMDHSSLSNITPEEFERNVEDAIHTLPDSPPPEKATVARSVTPNPTSRPSTPAGATIPRPSSVPVTRSPTTPIRPTHSTHEGEESAQPLALAGPPPMALTPMNLADDARRFIQRTGDTLSKPLNALGRIFADALDGTPEPNAAGPSRSTDGVNKYTYLPGPFAPFEMGREREREKAQGGGMQTPNNQTIPYQTPYRPRVRPTHPGSFSFPNSGYSTPDGTPSRSGPITHRELAFGPNTNAMLAPRIPSHLQSSANELGSSLSRTPTPALDIAGIQEEIDRATERAASASKQTLMQIFPSMDMEVIEWVLEAEEGDLGRSIEKLLEMSAES